MDAYMLLVAICAALAAGLAIRRLAAYLHGSTLLARLPTPPGAHLLSGHMHALSDPRHHHTMLRWQHQVGPIYTLRVFWVKMVVVSDPHLVHQLLRSDRGAGVDKSQMTYQEVNPMISEKGHPSLFSASTHSPYWRLVRKGTAPGFSSRCLRSGFRHIQAVCGEVVEQLHHIGPSTAFDVDNLLMRATLDVIGRVAFDINFRAVQDFHVKCPSKPSLQFENEEIFTIIRESMNELNLRWANPLRGNYFFWLPEVRKAMRYWRALQGHMRGVLLAIRSRGLPVDGDESIGAHLLRLKDPHTGGSLSDDRLLPEIATFFIAGTDTTAHTMAWTLYLVAQHPQVEARLCRELDALGLLATQQRPIPRMVEVEDLSKLVYLAAVVKESMRLMPVSADGTAVECPGDIQLGGYTIPANTIIWIHIFTTHNSSRYWDQPERFLPERFLQPGAEYVTASSSSQDAAQHVNSTSASQRPAAGAGSSGGQPLRFFPFSQGSRDCIGQSLAKMDYMAILAVLLGRYSFKLTPEAAAPGGVKDIISLTMQPENGLPVFAEPRVAAH